jgi:hypothetical protein
MEVMQQREKTESRRKLEEFDEKAMAIYESIKDQYEPQFNGKFLLINTESKQVFMSETLDDAMYLAKQKAERQQWEESPFFIVRIKDIDVGQMFSLVLKT